MFSHIAWCVALAIAGVFGHLSASCLAAEKEPAQAQEKLPDLLRLEPVKEDRPDIDSKEMASTTSSAAPATTSP